MVTVEPQAKIKQLENVIAKTYCDLFLSRKKKKRANKDRNGE
jgi:hypothetical protein